MNPYQNYGYPYPYPPQFHLYYPYYTTNQELANYSDATLFGYPTIAYFPGLERQNNTNREIEVIKVEDNSPPAAQNTVGQAQTQLKRRDSKNLKKKIGLKKVLSQNQNIYVHPPKVVQHKVKYFDPSAAPVITSDSYNVVEGNFKERERSQLLKGISIRNVNQVDYPEQDENPFIVFKFRRIKKKFKKYIKPKDEYKVTQEQEEQEESDSQTDQNNLSDQSHSKEYWKKERKPNEGMVKLSDDNVEGFSFADKGTEKSQQFSNI